MNASRFEFDFESFFFSFAAIIIIIINRLVLLAFLPSFFIGRSTTAALRSEVDVDGNRKEVVDRVAILQTLPEVEDYVLLLVLPLCGSSTSTTSLFKFVLCLFFCLPLLSLLRVACDASHSSKAYNTWYGT